MNHDLEEKIILITGATDGIGKAAAMNFAKRGASLTIVGRSKEKTEQVLAELKSASGNPDIGYLLADFSSLADVKALADAFKATHDRIDVLANNAGATFKTPSLTKDGFELTFALNHLAPFLLTHELFDLVRGTPNARVVTTSSSMQARGVLDLERTPTSLDEPAWRAYATSKLANVLFTKELQRRLEGTTATANCFEPGMVRTRFGAYGADLGWLLNVVYALSKPFASTPEEGADSLVWLATSPDAGVMKGQYISKRQPAVPSRQAQDPKFALDFWDLSERLCCHALAATALRHKADGAS